jgi:hypothetical protein
VKSEASAKGNNDRLLQLKLMEIERVSKQKFYLKFFYGAGAQKDAPPGARRVSSSAKARSRRAGKFFLEGAARAGRFAFR